jgi:hypothetical protein
MSNPFFEHLAEPQSEIEAELRYQVVFVAATIEKWSAWLHRRIAAFDVHTKISVACVVTGIATLLISASVASVGSVGSGYFVRFGVLLLGIGVSRLLRR